MTGHLVYLKGLCFISCQFLKRSRRAEFLALLRRWKFIKSEASNVVELISLLRGPSS